MAIDNIIAAGIQPATSIMSPMQTMGGLMQLRGQMADQALRAAQVQEVNQRRQLVEAEQTQKNRDLTDQNLLTAKEQDAEFMKRLYGGDLSMLSGLGLQDKTIQAMNTHINDTISKKATTDTTTLANQRTASTEIGTSLDSLTQMRLPDGKLDVVRVNESLPDLVRRLSPQLAVLGIDPNTVPTTITDESQLMTIAAKNNALQALITSANARKEQQAKTDKAVADAAVAEKVNVGTSERGVSEVQRLQNEASAATRAEQKRRDDETYRHNLQTERAAFMNASKEAKPKAVPATVIKGLAANTQMLSTIDEALDALDPKKEGDPGAVGFKGLLSDTILNRLDPKGTTARALLARLAAQEFHDFSGAAVTPSEAARLKPFLPSVNDDVETVRTKLATMRKQIQGLNEAQREAYAEGFQALPGDKAAAKAGSAGASHKVGDTVQFRNKRIKISAIHADGTFDGDEVK